MITIQRLEEVFKYDPETGRLSRGGKLAGCLRKDGYRVVRIDDVLLYEHRVIWALLHGIWVEQIDHKDGDPSNNRPGNLRDATPTENLWNTRRPATNTSGIKGVAWHKQSKKWRAYYKQHGKQIALGLFSDINDAQRAYERAVTTARGEWVNLG